MQHGIKRLAGQNNFGRVEIIDQQEYAQLTIRPTKQTVEKIETSRRAHDGGRTSAGKLRCRVGSR